MTPRALGVRLAAAMITVLAPLLVAEVALRLLPVNTGLQAEPVDARSPVFHFKPSQDFIYSSGWNLAMRNAGHVNNAGFVNDQDYTRSGLHPLLAVIGDSYVEAAMVPFAETVAGRLSRTVGERGRVYSFGASGAPLSQYLVWARHAVKDWGADALAVVVVGNDFDESLAAYKTGPGFHHYAEEKGELVLCRFDYLPSAWRILLRRSALARYLVLNLHAERALEALPGMWSIAEAQAMPPKFDGNVESSMDAGRMAESRRAVDAALRDFPVMTGLAPSRIAFFVDGHRYPGGPEETYFNQIRTYFIAAARKGGFDVVDLDEMFIPHARQYPQDRFEWPRDGHWNATGHGLAAEAVTQSALFQALFR